MNYYELLEISPSASVEVIRNAYKTLAKKYHPDTYKGDASFADEKMKLLNEAVSVLEDEVKRKEYNKINGINPLSQSGYSDYGRNNMLNFDENGEPIFFTYDSDEADGDYDGQNADDAAYMAIIDDFLNGGKTDKPKKKKPRSSKKKESAAGAIINNISDIDDISEIDAVDSNNGEIEFGYENLHDSEDAENSEESFKTFNLGGKSRAKSKAKSSPRKNRIYYIVLASLIAADIFLGILVVQSVDWSNIKNIMSGDSESSDLDGVDEDDFGIEIDGDPGDYDYDYDYDYGIEPPTNPLTQPATEPTIATIEPIEEETMESTAASGNNSATTTAAPTSAPTEEPGETEPPETTAGEEITAEPVTITETKEPEPVPTQEITISKTVPSDTTEEPTILNTTSNTTETEPIPETAETTEPPPTETEAVTVPSIPFDYN